MKFSILLLVSLILNTAAFAQSLDPDFAKQWYLKYEQKSLGIDAIGAWSMTRGNKNVVVAVVDTGVDYNHPELKPNMWVNKLEIPNNGIDDDGNGYIDDVIGYNIIGKNNNPMDDHGHGTHVAGIIGAAHNGIGINGVMANVQIMAVKCLAANGSATMESIVEGIRYAVRNGAHVINLSVGGSANSTALVDAITYANTNHVVVVAAAGNSNTTAPSYPAAINSPNVISVAAVDSANLRSAFSNYGKNIVHLFAPGSAIYSLFPNNSYKTLDGTSMATPIVAGVVGLVLSIHGTAAAPTMRDRLMFTSRKLRRLDGFVTSNGVVNAPNAIKGQLSFDFLVD